MVDNLPSGVGIHYWLGRETRRSKWRIDDDQMNFEFPGSKRKPYACEIYRNPQGARESLDEFLTVCPNIVATFAVFPVPDDVLTER